jgi:hypothetical protein
MLALTALIVAATGMRLTPESKKRYCSKIEKYKYFRLNCWNEQEYFAHAEPLAAFVKKAETMNLRRKINGKYG